MTKVCGWCGQPLDHYGETPEGAETCEDVYGVCQPALDHQSQLLHEEEVRRQQAEYEEQQWLDLDLDNF